YDARGDLVERSLHTPAMRLADFTRSWSLLARGAEKRRTHHQACIACRPICRPKRSTGREGPCLFATWRRGWDSNPRYIAVRLISSQVHSTTLPPLQDSWLETAARAGSISAVVIQAESDILAHFSGWPASRGGSRSVGCCALRYSPGARVRTILP